MIGSNFDDTLHSQMITIINNKQALSRPSGDARHSMQDVRRMLDHRSGDARDKMKFIVDKEAKFTTLVFIWRIQRDLRCRGRISAITVEGNT